MKILILSTVNGCSWAGTEEVWYQFAKVAIEKGHKIMLAADHEIAAAHQVSILKSKGLLVSSRRPFKPSRLYLVKQKIFDDHHAAIRWKPDICLINSGSPLDLEYCAYLREFVDCLVCPKAFFCHFNSDRLAVRDRGKLAGFFQEMDVLVFVNEANKLQLESQLATDFPKAKVILNSSRLRLSHPLPLPETEKVAFANVGRLDTYWKGQDILIEIFSTPNWSRRNWSLEFFGVGKDKAYLEKLIELRGLNGSAFLGGYEGSVQQIWENRSILLLPSRGEGTPLVVLEAMMCGRPVVATDVGGNSEIIHDGITGYISDAPTVKSFGRTLERAWAERKMWREMGANAHEHAKKLAMTKPADELLGVLENVLTERSGKHSSFQHLKN
jgi:glycosyltransferase involved in cell wall biosynthesis